MCNIVRILILYIYAGVYMYVRVCICMYICVCTYMYVWVCMYRYICIFKKTKIKKIHACLHSPPKIKKIKNK